MTNPRRCPRCSYVRRPSDSHVHEGLCPHCSIAYAKWAPREGDRERSGSSDGLVVVEDQSLRARFLDMITYVPAHIDVPAFWGRAAILVLFFFWGWSFILSGVSWEKIGGSFLHNVNLPFHEFGHLLFGFLGRFMGILGGSLFQILMPLIATFAFSWQMRDNFAAAITLWWCGQNFIDVAPYIADAPHRDIPLILGLSDSHHDWGNLLTMTGALDSAGTLANLSFGIGTLIMLVSYGWGARILYLQKQRLR